jgi:hypothetical protein
MQTITASRLQTIRIRFQTARARVGKHLRIAKRIITTTAVLTWAVTKSVLTITTLLTVFVLAAIVALMCYGVIIVPDTMWWRLARHYPKFTALEPRTIRTVALILGFFCVLGFSDSAKAIGRWFDVTFPTRKGQ